MGELGGCVSYEDLKKLAADSQTSALSELKNHLSSKINSVRRLQCLRTIEDLLDCLERLDIISEDNIDTLVDVALYTGNQQLQKALAKYALARTAQTGFELKNEYQDQRLNEEFQQQLSINSSRSKINHTALHQIPNTTLASSPYIGISAVGSVVPPTVYPVALTEQKRSAIYKTISQELGSYWRRLGRELEISEGAMDQIELQFPRDLPSRIYKLLQLFEQDDIHDPKKHVFILCQALNNCQRKDIRRKIEIIMSH